MNNYFKNFFVMVGSLFKNKKNKEIDTEKLLRMFQVLLTLFTFFPVILDAITGNTNPQKTTLGFGSSLAVLIFVYLIIEIFKNKLCFSTKFFLNVFIYINLFSFIPVLFILGLNNEQLSLFVGKFLIFSFQILIYSPVFMLIGLILIFLIFLLNKNKKVL